MGQAASKAVGRATKAATRGAEGRAASAAMKSDPSAASGTTQQPPPQPDAITGFYRGQMVSERERSQQQFLRDQQANQPQEMPPELIRFMRDIGPLQKRENVTQPTNPHQHLPKKKKRAPRGLRGEEQSSPAEEATAQQSQSQQKETNTRRRESMRLVEGIEGFETNRTTNFSHAPLDAVDPNDVGIDLLQIYRLLLLRDDNQNANVAAPQLVDPAARKERDRLLAHTKEYLELPVLMKDADDTYVGAWPHQVRDLRERHRGLREACTRTQVVPVLQDLWETEQNEKQQQASSNIGKESS